MITLKDLRDAAKRLDGVVVRTPVLPLRAGPPGIFLKCENLQRSGAFKLRGAYNRIASLPPKVRKRGVVAYSSGNHAQGVALAAKLLGVPAAIVMLDASLPHKVEGTRAYGAEVIFGGATSEETRRCAEELAAKLGRTLVRPFDDPFIIAGQGTVGLEIVEQLPTVKSVVVQIGGGGLCSGISAAVRALKPRVKVFGVEPEGAPKMRRALDAGAPVTLPSTATIADGLKPLRAGDLTFEHVSKLVEDVALVPDAEIMAAAKHLLLKEKLVVEPSGAAALAAVLNGRLKLPKGPVVAVLSGGNADVAAILSA